MTNNSLTIEELTQFIDQKALEHQRCDEEDDWLYEQIEIDTLQAIFEVALIQGFQLEDLDLERLLAGEDAEDLDEDDEYDFEEQFPDGLGGTLIRLYERITTAEDPEFIAAPDYLFSLLTYFENTFWPAYQDVAQTESEGSQLWFFHGLESGPLGTKSLALKALYPQLQTPDFQNLDFEQRLTRAEELTEGCKDLIIVGSSFGGLLAAALYSKHPERIANYLLLAPTLHKPEANWITKMPPQAGILHGIHDEIVPIETVKAFVAKYEISVTEIDDGHRLSEPESLAFITQWVQDALSFSS